VSRSLLGNVSRIRGFRVRLGRCADSAARHPPWNSSSPFYPVFDRRAASVVRRVGGSAPSACAPSSTGPQASAAEGLFRSRYVSAYRRRSTRHLQPITACSQRSAHAVAPALAYYSSVMAPLSPQSGRPAAPLTPQWGGAHPRNALWLLLSFFGLPVGQEKEKKTSPVSWSAASAFNSARARRGVPYHRRIRSTPCLRVVATSWNGCFRTDCPFGPTWTPCFSERPDAPRSAPHTLRGRAAPPHYAVPRPIAHLVETHLRLPVLGWAQAVADETN